jgi:hypothetical protein
MSGKLTTAILLAILTALITIDSFAQTARGSVSGAEVTGTFRMPFRGKYKGSFNEIRILALGKGKLRIAFELTYPYTMSDGGLMANTGEADGTAEISGDTAAYTPAEGGCRITIKFVKPGTIRVTQEEGDGSCGFGLNVTADGTYKKVSGARPKF